MNKLTELLRSPYPTLYQRWKAVVIPAVIIFFILYTLQPFGISRIEGNKLVVAAGSALVAAGASCIFAYLLPALFPSYYKEQNWTVGKYLLNLFWLLLLIVVGIWAYQSWLMGMWLDGRVLLLSFCWVMVLAPFPTVFFLLWNRNLLLTRNLKEATEMNFHLSRKVRVEDKAEEKKFPDVGKEISSKLLIFSGGTKERLEVEADYFCYAEAEGNYVKVVYCPAKGGKTVPKLLRITMKQAEEAVAACPYIIRCHRAFLVNMQKVMKVDGNSQGYRLWLEGCGEEVPVSRAYAKKVKSLIENKV